MLVTSERSSTTTLETPCYMEFQGRYMILFCLSSVSVQASTLKDLHFFTSGQGQKVT